MRIMVGQMKVLDGQTRVMDGETWGGNGQMRLVLVPTWPFIRLDGGCSRPNRVGNGFFRPVNGFLLANSRSQLTFGR